jgi:hypothetical protein
VWSHVEELRWLVHVGGLSTFVVYNKIETLKVPRRFVDGKLYRHVHNKIKNNQNEVGDNRRSLWQGE